MALNATSELIQTDPVLTLVADAAGKFVVPDGTHLFNAEFGRSGYDLILSNEGAADIRIPGYFLSDPPEDLFDPSGALIRGEHVALMAGPIAPGQYAQAGQELGASPIGQVEILDGQATVQRVDGTVEALQVGMKVFQHDVLETGDGTSLSVTFVDGTIFTLASGSRMVIDELIYDPASNENSGGFSLIQGSFVFIAGQVAKTGGMEVSTPSSTMGIRGTTVVVEVSSENGVVTSEITLAEDIDGEIGRIELKDIEGNLVADIQETNTKWVVQAFDGAVREVDRSPLDELSDSILIAEAFAAFRSAASRVEAGDTFVTLSDPASQQQVDDIGQEPSLDFDVDSVDDPESIAPPTSVDELPEEEGFQPIDEGLNQVPDEPIVDEPTIITVQGNEDTVVEAAIDLSDLGELVFELVQPPANGDIVLAPDGNFTFDPDPDFNGNVSFTFTYTSLAGLVEEGTVVIALAPENDAPIAEDAAATIAEDTILSGTIPASDIDNDVLNYTVVGTPSSGEVLLFQNGNFTYTPNPDFNGSDSFTVMVTDAAGVTAQSTISVIIDPENDEPVIVTPIEDVAKDILEADTPVIVDGTLVASDADDGAVLTWSGSASGAYGDFVITGDGEWAYTLDPAIADALVAGEVVTDVFTAVVTDEDGLTQSIQIPITITGTDDGPDVVSPPNAALGALSEGDEVFEVSDQVEAVDPDEGGTVTWSGTSEAVYGTFTLTADGTWSYVLDNALADSLSEGQTVVETLQAVATDESGNTTTLPIAVTVTGTNDQPTVTPVVIIETIENTAVSGVVSGSDVDGNPAALTYSVVPSSVENGSVVLNTDGTYTFTPTAGFVGVASFQYQVSDADGGVTTGLASILVENDPDDTSNKNVDIALNPEATDDTAANAVEIAVQKTDTTSINLAIALDRSGSIGETAWAELLTSVQTSVTTLSDLFADSDTNVEVQIITFASDVETTAVFDLQDPALLASINPVDLPFSGGATAWDLAFQQAGQFFFSEPSNELNTLFFVTDGIPSSGTWVTPFDALVDPNDDFDVDIEAFGFGPLYENGTLDDIDDDPIFFTDPSQLSDAFSATPIFNPELIGFKIELVADGNPSVQIADENSDGLILEGTNFELPLASIENIASLLGVSNSIAITAEFDLNNDLSDTEITLFSSETIGKATSAQNLEGKGRADLLFGSDEADVINGAGGGDVILAYGGDDTVSGGDGADTILAGAGNDRVVVSSAPEAGDSVDGQEGRDTLAFDAVGEINDMIATLDISGVEVLDIDNSAADALALNVDEIIAFSDEDDTELQDLLEAALPNTRSFVGNLGDTFTIDGQGKYSVALTETVTDGDGNSLDVYAFSNGDGDVLAALGVDNDIAVTTQNVVT